MSTASVVWPGSWASPSSAPLYNAINFNYCPYTFGNSTVVSDRDLRLFWCPSDGKIVNLGFYENEPGWDGSSMTLRYTSYAGMIGTYCIQGINGCDQRAAAPADLTLQNGAMIDTGLAHGCRRLRHHRPSHDRLDHRRDEQYDHVGRTLPEQAQRRHRRIRVQGLVERRRVRRYVDLFLLSAERPEPAGLRHRYGARGRTPTAATATPRAARATPPSRPRACIPAESTSSFCDGSVHFIKNSINSWNYNPPNMTRSGGNATAPCFPFSASGNGVWQSLSTISGGEVISSDSVLI